MSEIAVQTISLNKSFGNVRAVQDLNLTVHRGDILSVIGPSGCGKTTLLRAIAQTADYQGHIYFEGEDIARMKHKARAKAFATLSQRHGSGYAFTAEEVIRLGRYARKSFLGSGDERGEQAVREAIALTGVEGLLRQSVLTLSGGELQRVFLAQVFAQDPRLLLLDEPANHLDLKYMEQIFELIARWVKRPGRAVISVVHDLSLTKLYGTTAALLHEGSLLGKGPVSEVLSPGLLQTAYGMDVQGYMRRLLKAWENE
mgnify:CR=1 FL=1